MESKEVEEAVLETIADILLCDKAELWLSARLVDDLNIDSDDLSLMFVPDLEKRLKVKIPIKEWNNVYTIQDAIDLLRKYMADK